MNTQLTTLKTELREFIELSKTITQGKWSAEPDSDGSFFIHAAEEMGYLTWDCSKTDATFIARSRNISPAMAECLLIAVECIEAMSIEVNVECSNEALEAYAQDTKLAQEHLEKILNIWEAAK